MTNIDWCFEEVGVDWGFIEELEGNSFTGYVPFPEGSNSGVTIGCGFDLGQICIGDLVGMFGDYSPITDLLSVYVGRKGYEALNILNLIPLTCYDTEISEINKVVRDRALTRLISNIIHLPFWATLDSKAKTVIMSVSFQYGDLTTRTPNFWRQVTEQDWEGALANLRDFKDDYPTRRNKEADLLEEFINESKI